MPNSLLNFVIVPAPSTESASPHKWHTCSGPPSESTAEMKLRCRSGVQRSRGFTAPGWPGPAGAARAKQGGSLQRHDEANLPMDPEPQSPSLAGCTPTGAATLYQMQRHCTAGGAEHTQTMTRMCARTVPELLGIG